MNEINYWEKFMETGKIDDFLAYRNAAEDTRAMARRETEGLGEHSHAGLYRDYGDGAKG